MKTKVYLKEIFAMRHKFTDLEEEVGVGLVHNFFKAMNKTAIAQLEDLIEDIKVTTDLNKYLWILKTLLIISYIFNIIRFKSTRHHNPLLLYVYEIIDLRLLSFISWIDTAALPNFVSEQTEEGKNKIIKPRDDFRLRYTWKS